MIEAILFKYVAPLGFLFKSDTPFPTKLLQEQVCSQCLNSNQIFEKLALNHES